MPLTDEDVMAMMSQAGVGPNGYICYSGGRRAPPLWAWPGPHPLLSPFRFL